MAVQRYTCLTIIFCIIRKIKTNIRKYVILPCTLLLFSYLRRLSVLSLKKYNTLEVLYFFLPPWAVLMNTHTHTHTHDRAYAHIQTRSSLLHRQYCYYSDRVPEPSRNDVTDRKPVFKKKYSAHTLYISWGRSLNLVFSFYRDLNARASGAKKMFKMRKTWTAFCVNV